MRIYVAGPMRGYPSLNFAAFDEAKERWTNRRIGDKEVVSVVTPADMDREAGVGPAEAIVLSDGTLGPDDFMNLRPRGGIERRLRVSQFLREAIQKDLATIMRSDAIVVLEGWERSVGSTLEVAMANFLALPIYHDISGESLNLGINKTPWDEIKELWNRIGSLEDDLIEAGSNDDD